MSLPFNSLKRALLLGALCILFSGCAAPESGETTPTPDIALLETRTEAQLAARLTAIAPIPTATATPMPAPPTPVPTPRPTLTPTLVPTGSAPPLVIVNVLANGSANIIVPPWAGEELVLTHFIEPMSISAVRWLPDGEHIGFTSSHDFVFSRDNENNVFVMRADGSEQRMLTGQHVAPEDAVGPFVALEGRVEGSAGFCRVTAQGMASLVDADETGAFVIEGVPQEATWARAVCQDGATTLQGSVDLDLSRGPGEIVITAAPGGQGWRDVSFAPDGERFVGTYYQWRLDDAGEVVYELAGVLYDVAVGEYGRLELPEGMSFHGAAWSPDGERIVGGLSDEEMAYLWEWDVQGVSVGELYRIDNPEDQILTIMRPTWSSDGSSIAFELHRWYWWSGQKFRTDLMTVDADGQNAITLLEPEWGWHATNPSWGMGGASVFYQFYASEIDLGGLMPVQADIWSVDVESLESARWTQDGGSFLPAVRPRAAGS